MKRYKLNLSDNPSFNSVTELTNTSFNPNNYVEGRMATEEQISQLYNRIVEQEQRRDKCCRDIIIWEARTQIVRLNSNTMNNVSNLKDSYFTFNSGGVVISSFDENVNTGTMRRGLPYTVTFPVKWNDELYFPYTAMRYSYSGGTDSPPWESISSSDFSYHGGYAHTHVEYRFSQNKSFQNAGATQSTNTNRAFFLAPPYDSDTPTGTYSGSNTVSSAKQYSSDNLTRMNVGNNWYSFIRTIENDGTITIKDNRNNTNYDVIRFYTQWCLNRCADGSLLSDAANARVELWNSTHPEKQYEVGVNLFLK